MSEKNITTRLLTAQHYFSNEQAVFDTLSRGIEKRNNIEKFRNGNTFLKFLGIVGFIVYCIKYFVMFSKWFLEKSKFVESIFKGIATVIPKTIVLILWLILTLICFVGLYVLGFMIANIIDKILKKVLTEPSYKRQTVEIIKKVEELTEIYKSYESVTGDTCPIPFERCHPMHINQLMQVISAGRADAVKEAINVIIQDEHNQKMVELAEQQIHSMQQANAYLKEISRNTKWIEWNTFWN